MIGWIRMFLELPIFTVGARLVYAMYLIHVPIMYWWLAYWIHPMEFNVASFTVPYIGFVFSTIFASIGLYLLVSIHCLSDFVFSLHLLPSANPVSIMLYVYRPHVLLQVEKPFANLNWEVERLPAKRKAAERAAAEVKGDVEAAPVDRQ